MHRCNFKILVSIINEVFVSIPKKQKTSNNVSDLMLIHQYDFPTLPLKKYADSFLFAASDNAIIASVTIYARSALLFYFCKWRVTSFAS